MYVLKLMLIGLVTTALGCQAPSEMSEADMRKKATEIVQSSIIVDGHIDVPYRLVDKMVDVSKATEGGDFDYPRAKQGGLDGPFMSIFIPAELQTKPGASKQHAEMLIAMMDSIIQENLDKFAHARSPADVESNFRQGLISLPYGMENGSAIEDDLENVEYFFDQGIRYVTLTHGKKNLICDSSYDPDKGWDGLSPFGEQVVAEMNRLGVFIDISHVSDSTFYQVLRLSKAPVICSHSSCRRFTPGFERNVNDDMLRALAKNGGVIQINFGSAFLTEEANRYSTASRAHITLFMNENNIIDQSDPRVEAENARYREVNPYPYATVEDVADHIDHVVKIAGIDHVGIGSDFDGVGDSLPTGIKSVAEFPNLVYHLLKRGYSEGDIKKILGENVLRAWREVERIAAEGGEDAQTNSK